MSLTVYKRWIVVYLAYKLWIVCVSSEYVVSIQIREKIYTRAAADQHCQAEAIDNASSSEIRKIYIAKILASS